MWQKCEVPADVFQCPLSGRGPSSPTPFICAIWACVVKHSNPFVDQLTFVSSLSFVPSRQVGNAGKGSTILPRNPTHARSHEGISLALCGR